MERKTIVLDIRFLPIEYKDLELKEAVKKYQEDFKVIVIPIDGSRANIEGISSITPITQLT